MKKTPATPTTPTPGKAKAGVKAPSPSKAKTTTAAKRPAAKKARAPAKKAARKKAEPAVVAQVETVAPVDPDALTPEDGDLMGLSVREANFIDYYLACLNGEKAYIQAGFNSKPGPSAQACASRLLNSAKVQPFLCKRMKAMLDRNEVEQDRLLTTFTNVAFADPRELMEYRIGSCRFCHGRLHRYQFTAGQWENALEKHEEYRELCMSKKDPFDPGPLDTKGGVGYDWRVPPHEDCPECFGQGEGREIFKDTSNLSPAALSLYAGVKRTKDGLELLTHDQAKARETVAKIRQMYDDKAAVTVNLDMETADARFAKRMGEAQARQEAVLARRKESGMTGD